jgi:hypothetical protein
MNLWLILTWPQIKAGPLTFNLKLLGLINFFYELHYIIIIGYTSVVTFKNKKESDAGCNSKINSIAIKHFPFLTYFFPTDGCLLYSQLLLSVQFNPTSNKKN